jgi:tetratricopeptide (TPR) repeat protein
VVSHAPSDEDARLNLAIARLGAGQLDAARADYQELLKSTSRAGNALFGLGGIAWRKNETNTAMEFYEQFLATAKPGSPQYLIASGRIKQLQDGRAQPEGSENRR